MRNRTSFVLLAIGASLLTPSASPAVAAFPEAKGFGADTPGGRGGQVLYVTTLDDHDDGVCNAADCTLREAINRTGPRIVLFKVGGTIVLKPLLGPLVIDEPYITIAGQSARGDGIEIRNNPDGTDNARAFISLDVFTSIVIATHDVVLRHLRIRPGPLTPNPNCTAINAVPRPPSVQYGDTCGDARGIKAIEVANDASNIVLDHLSLGWASYNLTLLGSGNLTLQNSISSEGLDYVENDGNICRYNHPGQDEQWPTLCPRTPFDGMGFMSGNTATAQQGRVTGPYSLHHNLFAHNSARNPQITVKCLDTNAPLSCAADVVNNVTYNWQHADGGFGVLSGNALGNHFGNVVNNYIKGGPESTSIAKGLTMSDYTYSGIQAAPGVLSVYHSGNRSFVSPGVSAALSPVCGSWTAAGVPQYCPGPSIYDPGAPFATPPVGTTSADQAYDDVLNNAGASLRREANGSATFNRDANDQRVIDSVRAANGGLINSFDEFPGFPSLVGGPAYPDSDSDGMPDEWETAQCLNPNAANSSGDADGDGYTNVEEFLNGTQASADHDGDGILTGCDVACDNGFDDDGDGQVDFPADPGCDSLTDPSEYASNQCGLIGIEVLPVLIGAAYKSRRRRVRLANAQQ